MKTFLTYIFNWLLATITLVMAFAAVGFTFGIVIASVHTAAKFGYSLL